MDIRLIAIDLDGTGLLDDHMTIAEVTLEAMRAALSAGIVVMPSTGRTRALLARQMTELPGVRYALTSNGAAVWDMQEESLLHTDLISPESVEVILPMLRRANQLVELFVHGKIVVEQSSIDRLWECHVPNHHKPLFENGEVIVVPDAVEYLCRTGQGVEKINLTRCRPEMFREFYEKIHIAGLGKITSALERNMEINTLTANKGAGLAALCQHLGLEMTQVMALGDSSNDLEALEMAGWGVAMGNGSDACKRAARMVTASNTEDGVALAINSVLAAQPAAACSRR